MAILTYIAIQDGRVKKSSLEVLTRSRQIAAEIGVELHAVIIDTDAPSFADEVARYGASRIYTITDPVFDRHQNAPLLAALHAVALRAEPSLFTFASTEAVKSVLGALAVRLNAGVLPDVSRFDVVEGGVEAVRPVMAAKILCRQVSKAETVLVSVRSGSYDAVEAPVDAQVEAILFSFEAPENAARLREVITAGGSAVDLSEADVVVAFGRGVRDEEGKRLVDELAQVLGAAVGGSRAVVETGLLPATAQIGQTGKVVSPTLYIGLGISGAIQHAAGMQNSKVIVAVNRDPDAAIFRYATYGIVGDLYKVVPLLTEKLRAARA